MNISRHRLYAMGEPLGESASRIESGRLICGGGGGGSSQKNYANLERLYGIQSDSAQLLYDQANKFLPQATGQYMGEVSEVMNPDYSEAQARKAATDMADANAGERAATVRELSSMGVNPSDPRFSGALLDAEVNGAARLAAGKNIARDEANKMQRAVAQDAVGTLTGQSNSAASQLGGATSGLASLYNTKNQQKASEDANKSNAVGNAVGAGIMALSFKNGGEVCGRFATRGVRKLERHNGLFGSGEVGSSQRGFLSPSPPPPPQGPQATSANPVGAGISGAMRTKRVGDALRGIHGGEAGVRATDNIGRIVQHADKESGDRILNYNAGKKLGPDQSEQAAKAYDAAAKEVTDPALQQEYAKVAADLRGGAGIEAGAGEVAAQVAEGTAGAAGEAVAGGVAAESAVAEGAAGTAAAEGVAAGGAATGAATGLGAAASAIGTALPWVGAAYTVGSLLGAWKDGGEIEGSTAQDLRDGSRVNGPGGHTDDLVPALLSDEEHVMNAEASAFIGHDELERLNKIGLELRQRGIPLSKIKTGFGMRRGAQG